MSGKMIVEYMSHGGDDLLCVNAARCSFGKESKELDAKDIKLLNYLAKEGHWLPFRHPSLTLRCKAPMFVARQMGKHQTGFSWSEESRRYVKTAPEFYWPEKWRKAAENVKQGSSDEEVTEIFMKEFSSPTESSIRIPVSIDSLQNNIQAHALFVYDSLLASGVAPEQARMILPQNLMITWVWTGTLLAWMNMLKARLASDTQAETRELARLIAQHVQERFPHSYEAINNASIS